MLDQIQEYERHIVCICMHILYRIYTYIEDTCNSCSEKVVSARRFISIYIHVFMKDFSSFDIMLLHLKLHTCYTKHFNVIIILFNSVQ